MDEESRYKIGPATKYAQDFVKRVKRPLTEDDLAHAFSAGKDFGRSTRHRGSVPLCPHYEGNYCPRCGQSAKIGRYSFKKALLLHTDVGPNDHTICVCTNQTHLVLVTNINN